MYVLLDLIKYHSTTSSFDLWMWKGECNIFALVFFFLKLIGSQSTLPLAFEAIDTSGQTLTKNVTKLLDIYKQTKKIIAYVKDEGFNLNIIATTLKSIVNCDLLNLKENFQRTCFGHVFSETCQHATT